MGRVYKGTEKAGEYSESVVKMTEEAEATAVMPGNTDEVVRLMRLLEASHTGERQRASAWDCEDVKIARLTDEDDIESYLTTFERLMEAYTMRPDRWAFKLAPQLTGRAQQAYAAIPAEEVKRTINV